MSEETRWKTCAVAFLLDQDSHFRIATHVLLFRSSHKQIESAIVDGTLSEEFKEAMLKRRMHMAEQVTVEIERVIDSLRSSNETHETDSKVCQRCLRLKPPPTKRCGPCANDKVRGCKYLLLPGFEGA